MADVGWMEATMMFGIVATLVALVALVATAGRVAAQAARPEPVTPEP